VSEAIERRGRVVIVVFLFVYAAALYFAFVMPHDTELPYPPPKAAP
jgi:hypothetical protein